MINKDRFNFCIDFDIDKAAKKDDENKYDNMIFYGMASDNSKDTESEVLEPSGYDLSYFMKNGLFNLEHFTKRKGDAKFWIGEPLESEIKNNKFFVTENTSSTNRLITGRVLVADISGRMPL